METEITTASGNVLDVMVESSTVGKTLNVSEIALYPRDATRLPTAQENVSAILRLRTRLVQQAREAGYERVKGQYHFTKNGRVMKFDYPLIS